MTVEVITVGYSVGSTLTIAGIYAMNAHSRTLGAKEPFPWDWEFGPFQPNLGRMMLWPITWVCAAFAVLGRVAARRTLARIAAEKERERWLAAKVPE